ncbi:LysR family transcriptional regulator [Methylobacterium durans]|uniref:LysR family transcriptional regulator n=1 Tax=Methylobacterium durans TaxID=2202825 RepID=UPI002AFFFD38|nr:LysR family transcriptional regulator [Methylobacterium durans]MEA1834383.1 LysR family transcriptional regulator [Methylobacterium durans]
MMDRYLLRYFLAVVDCGSFSRAAAQENVAQPTLSVGVAKLERYLGAKLFHRTSQRVQLTEAGARLSSFARRIESEFNRAEAAVLGLEPVRLFRLGVLTTIPTAPLASFVAQAAAHCPEMQVELVEGAEGALLQRLRRGRVDAALTLLRPDEPRFAQELFLTESYALALPASHRLADRTSIPADELADEVMIVRRQCEVLSETSRHFVERGVRPFFALKTLNDDRALALVRAGLGITVMPESYASEGIRMPQLAGFRPERRIGLLWAEESEGVASAAKPLVDLLRAAFDRDAPRRPAHMRSGAVLA